MDAPLDSVQREEKCEMKLIFDVGDIIVVGTTYNPIKGQIVALRHAVGNHRTGDLCAGADVLCSDGKVRFCFLHDIARANKERLNVLS
jgi:hypothetical protein